MMDNAQCVAQATSEQLHCFIIANLLQVQKVDQQAIDVIDQLMRFGQRRYHRRDPLKLRRVTHVLVMKRHNLVTG